MLIAGVLLFAVGATATLTPADLRTASSSELQKIEAFLGRGRNCIYNDVLYSDGQTIEVYQESCSKLVCRVIPGILNIGSTNHIYLKDLDNCKCSIITPRLPFPVLTVRKVTGTPEKLVSKNFVNLTKLLDLDLKLGCYFNNSFVFANNYVEHLPSKCSLLQCNMDDGRPKMELFVKSICFCGANATTSATSATTSTTSPTTTASSISTTSSPSPSTMTSPVGPTTTISSAGPTPATSPGGPTTMTSPAGPTTTTSPVGPTTTTSSAGPTPTTSSAGPSTTTSSVGPTPTTSSASPTPTTSPVGPSTIWDTGVRAGTLG
ncbi:cell wall integrity and stress response component 2 [Hyalella azteca]|uniref:Cell wall integrity and stress response component 2 n=1 Tax=Hyalella azteca TaxID=294128 RepID=A0A8B7PA36_HYAAZ|nr:cell wall integrity and stress response component 2 [Hyalella azteca]